MFFCSFNNANRLCVHRVIYAKCTCLRTMLLLSRSKCLTAKRMMTGKLRRHRHWLVAPPPFGLASKFTMVNDMNFGDGENEYAICVAVVIALTAECQTKSIDFPIISLCGWIYNGNIQFVPQLRIDSFFFVRSFVNGHLSAAYLFFSISKIRGIRRNWINVV